MTRARAKRLCVLGAALVLLSTPSCSFPGEAEQARDRVRASMLYVNSEVANVGRLNVGDPSAMSGVVCSTGERAGVSGVVSEEMVKYESQFVIFTDLYGDSQEVVDVVAEALRRDGIDVFEGGGDQSVPLRAISARFGDSYVLTGPFNSDEQGELMYFSGSTRCYPSDAPIPLEG